MILEWSGVKIKSTESQIKIGKGWGYELWIVNNSAYCGKILWFEKGKKCSWHFHKLKTETFFVRSGKLEVTYSANDSIIDANKVVLLAGDSFEVAVGLRHQMKALEETELFEFSTQHFDSDSYRLELGD